jgi:MFS family permease
VPSRPSTTTALYASTVANMLGSGAYIAALAIFLTQARSQSAAAAASAILIGTLGGKAGALKLSRRVDLLGGRRTYLTTKLITGASMVLLAFASSTFVIIAALLLYGLFSAVGGAARNMMIRDLKGEKAAMFRARLRSLANVGIVLGTLLAAGLMSADSSVASVC